MKLFIDTSERERIAVKLDKKSYETLAYDDKSQKLIPFLVEVLKKNGKKITDIDEIEVNTGPGSFTGLRVGVAVANAIGWTLNIPVNGKSIKYGNIPEIKY